MKPLLATMVALGLSFTTGAFAADKVTVKMSPNEAVTLSAALSGLDGYGRVVHDARGEDISLKVPYDLGDVRLTIAHDIAVTAAVIKEAQSASQGLAQADMLKLVTAQTSVELLAFDVSALKLSSNPIPPTTLSQLVPVCPTCAAIVEAPK